MPVEISDKEKVDLSSENILYSPQLIENLKHQIELSGLRNELDKSKLDEIDVEEIVKNIADKEVYLVPIEDWKWNILKYKRFYINKDNSNEILKFPVYDMDWKIVRMQTICRNRALDVPPIDPIDFIWLWGGILKIFLKRLPTLAPTAGINLSKTAIVKLTKPQLAARIAGEEIPKEITANFAVQAFQN